MPDLTTLSARSGGTYPRAQVRAAVAHAGRLITAHGTREMPVWGPIFHALDANVEGASSSSLPDCETQASLVVLHEVWDVGSLQAPSKIAAIEDILVQSPHQRLNSPK